MAEEFAFDERGRERGTIDFEIWCVAARAKFVNEARKVVFAGAGFTGEEQRGGRRGDFFREFEQAARGGIFSNPGKAIGHRDIVASRGARETGGEKQ